MKCLHLQPVRHFFKKYNLGSCNLITVLGKVSSERWTVPDHIVKPSYYETLNKPSLTSGSSIEIKDEIEIAGMRASCKLAANILKKCESILKVIKYFKLELKKKFREYNFFRRSV